ncbi:MAG TPA: hypothetical protein VFY65_08020 [Longimicrobium sp.]|nr:hypothetical protein [Longimicrobium sp.]
MRTIIPRSLLFCALSAVALAGCSASTGPDPDADRVDTFDSNTLSSYTIYNNPDAWSIAGGYLTAGTAAQQSVVIRKDESMANGWVETETDYAADGGLVLRFQGDGTYYLLAIRDDSHLGYANLEMYRAAGGVFERIAGPVDLTFTRGIRRTVRFEARGTTLTGSIDGMVMIQAGDASYTAGGFGLRHDNTHGYPGVTSRFDLLRWPAR